jgi:hypothetical protein
LKLYIRTLLELVWASVQASAILGFLGGLYYWLRMEDEPLAPLALAGTGMLFGAIFAFPAIAIAALIFVKAKKSALTRYQCTTRAALFGAAYGYVLYLWGSGLLWATFPCGALVGYLAYPALVKLRAPRQERASAPAVTADGIVTDREARWLRWAVKAFLAIGIGGALFGASYGMFKKHEERDRPVEYRSVIVGDVGYRIPKKQFHPLVVPRDGAMQDQTLLDVMLPSVGVPLLSERERYRQGKSKDYGSLMIDNGVSKMTVSEFMEWMIGAYKTSDERGTVYGLVHLTQPADIRLDRDEIFFEGLRTDPKTFVHCHKVGDHPRYPQCQMHFYHRGNKIKVRFQRAPWLPHWQKIKESALQRLDGFHSEYEQHFAKEYRSVVIGGVGYRIPKKLYHPLSIPQDGAAQDSALLDVKIPEIAAPTLSPKERYRRKQTHEYGSLMIEGQFRGTHKTKTIPEFMDTMIGFNKTTESKPSQFGLVYLGHPVDVKSDRDEILYEGTREQPTTVLFCHKRISELSRPICQMHFYHRNNKVHISFNRERWLPEWRQIKGNVNKRLDQFHNAYLKNTSDPSNDNKKGIDHDDIDQHGTR